MRASQFIVANAHKQVFLNIVLDDAVEEKEGGEKVKIGMVVCCCISRRFILKS